MPGHSHEAADGAARTPQRDIELMPEKEVLDFKSSPRPEQISDKRPKQPEDHKHRAG